MRGFYCSVRYRLAFFASQLCVFHDQDRVLRGQADQGDNADLCVDVVRISAEIHREKGAKKSERHRQYDCKRNSPTFIQRRQKQEDQQSSEPENESFLTCCEFL